MSKRLIKIQGLFRKLEARYGQDDPDVQEVGARLKELEGLKAQGKKPQSRRAKSKPAQQEPRLM
jgi:hypothetical protein